MTSFCLMYFDYTPITPENLLIFTIFLKHSPEAAAVAVASTGAHPGRGYARRFGSSINTPEESKKHTELWNSFASKYIFRDSSRKTLAVCIQTHTPPIGSNKLHSRNKTPGSDIALNDTIPLESSSSPKSNDRKDGATVSGIHF
jgi:hypothetical protein